MKRIHVFSTVGIFVAVLLLAGAASAQTITFTEFPVGTVIGTQYAPEDLLCLPGIITGTLPIISYDGAVFYQPVLSPQGAGTPPQYYQFAGDFTMKFPTPASYVSFLSGYWDRVGDGIIDVYNPSGNLLEALTDPTLGVDQTIISGVGPIGSIYFNSISDPGSADIGDVYIVHSVPDASSTLILMGLATLSMVGFKRMVRS